MQLELINIMIYLSIAIIALFGEVFAVPVKKQKKVSSCYIDSFDGKKYFEHIHGPRECDIFCNKDTKEFGGFGCECCFEAPSKEMITGQPWYFYVISVYAVIVTIVLVSLVARSRRRRRYRRYQDTDLQFHATNVQTSDPATSDFCVTHNIQSPNAQETRL